MTASTSKKKKEKKMIFYGDIPLKYIYIYEMKIN